MGVRGIMNDVLREHVGLDNQNVRPPVYIAGAFGVSPQEKTDEAIKVGTLAMSKGFAPFVPHTSILAGVYGCDQVTEERENGMVATLSLLIQFARDPMAHLWVIKNQDGSMSQGTQMEYEVWLQVRQGLNYQTNLECRTYKDWLTFI